MSNSIDAFINRKVIVLKKNIRVMQAAKAMCENQVGCVIIINEESSVCGIVTDRDIVCNLIAMELDAETPLQMIMATDVISLDANSTIDQAIALMKEHGIRRLPIIEESKKRQQKCIGVVSLDDLIAAELIASKDLSEIIKSQIIRKKIVHHKRPHSDSRADQTYNIFIGKLAQDINLDNSKTEDVAKFILGAIVQRMHYTGAIHFISQLPKRIQDPLLDLPSGPDRTITDKLITQGITIRTGCDLKTAQTTAIKFCTTLGKLISHSEIEHVMHQLPEPIKKLFGVNSNKESQQELSL
jgi:CBS domain-containing protein